MKKIFIAKYGSKEQEMDRTAEMFLDLCNKGQPHLAFWLVVDSNRIDYDSLKFIANRIQERFKSN